MKSDQEWKQLLTPEQYRVCREKGTEAPFSGRYNLCKDEGIYRCVCCGNPLFASDAKFDSGSGWPSYWQAVSETAVNLTTDNSHGMTRVEVTCAKCDAHLGHVFEDGPEPTGQRFCINSVSIDLGKP